MKKAITLIATLIALYLHPTTAHALSKTEIKKHLLCIHHHEALWTNPGLTWDGRRSPYYGGLQMDVSFMHAYGWVYFKRWGYAHRWPIWAQLEAGYRAVVDRGYSPWPNSRLACGV